MKKLAVLLAVTGAFIFQPSAKAIELSGKETLSCEAVLCAVGIAIPESHSKCRKVLTEWSAYLATLGMFREPQKCPKYDHKGKLIGYDEMKCSAIQDDKMRKICNDAMGTGGYDNCNNVDQAQEPQRYYKCRQQCLSQRNCPEEK